VPAAAIVEEGAEDDARIIRQEARHRLRKGYGIRVFSRPEHLKQWFQDEGIRPEDRSHLITDAGQLVPGWTKDNDGVEFFVHSPFAERDGDVILDRNECSLVLQATFKEGDTKFLMTADTPWHIWEKIVSTTKWHGNEERLEWDIWKLPHHCSYLSLGPDKGKKETEPVEAMQWLIDQRRRGSIIVSTSKPIDDEDQDQPPHFQAKNCYKSNLKDKSGKFVVTMEHPNRVSPARFVVKITAAGASISSASTAGASALVSAAAPRVG
jgi:hypothetical protein